MIPASLFAGAVLAEIVLRVLLFNESALAQRLGADLRQPGYFSDANSDDDYWKLRHLFTPPDRRVACTGFDPVLGWTSAFVEPGTFQHLRSCPPDGRQLVLLYGDSFAACINPEPDCFPAILERSELAERYCMLNYGIGGYGLDQIYLMIKSSIDLYRDRKPFVIVGLLAENALERTVLSFRDWPKPRLHVVGGELELEAPVIDGFEGYIDAHPLRIRSYLWRYLLYRSALLPERWREALKGDHTKLDEKQAMARLLLREIDQELTSRDIEYVVLLFHARGALTFPDWAPWQEPLVREACADLGARVVSTRPYLLAANGGSPREPSRFYQQSGGGVGHLTPVGNAIVFEAMCDALDGRPESAPTADVIEGLTRRGFRGVRRQEMQEAVFGRPAHVVTDGDRVPVRASQSHAPPFDLWADAARECVASGVVGPTRVEIELAGAAQRLRATVRATVYPAAGVASGTVVIQVETDGEIAFREELAVGGEARNLDVDLTGTRRLVIVCAPVESTPPDAWVCLSDPQIE